MVAIIEFLTVCNILVILSTKIMPKDGKGFMIKNPKVFVMSFKNLILNGALVEVDLIGLFEF